MRVLLRLATVIDRFNRGLGSVVAWMTLGMVLLGAFNAVARYFDRYTQGGLSSNAYLELQWYLFSLVFLLGAPYALRAGAHVRVDVFYGRLGARSQAWIDLVGALVFLIPFCVFAVWTSWPLVLDSWEVWEQSPDPNGLPRYPIKTAIPVAFALIALQGCSEAIKRVAFLRGAAADEIGLHERRAGDGPSAGPEGARGV